MVLSTWLNTRLTHSKILKYVFLTKNLIKMKQNNKSITLWWHIYNNNDNVVAQYCCGLYNQRLQISNKQLEVYELMLWSRYESYNCLQLIYTFYIFCSFLFFFNLLFLYNSYIMTGKIIEIKNSVTGIYESVFIYSILISYHTVCYHDDCSYCYVSHMFGPFNMI